MSNAFKQPVKKSDLDDASQSQRPDAGRPAQSARPTLADANDRPATATSAQTFDPAGRGIRATAPVRADPGAPRRKDAADDVDSPSGEGEDDMDSDVSDPSDASSPIDDRIERRTRSQQTSDEEER